MRPSIIDLWLLIHFIIFQKYLVIWPIPDPGEGRFPFTILTGEAVLSPQNQPLSHILKFIIRKPTDSDFSFATIKSLCTVFSMIFYIFKNKTFFKPKFPSSSFLIHKLVIVLENRLIYNQLLVYNEHLRVNESRFMYYISKIWLEKQWLDSLMVKGLTKHWVSEVRILMSFSRWSLIVRLNDMLGFRTKG